MVIISKHSRPREAAAVIPLRTEYSLIIDAGHGGFDGGAEANGIAEAPLNLAISLRLRDLLRFAGISALMTREDGGSLDFNAEAEVRENKVADLKARLRLAQENPECDFLSIHLNKFEQEKYYGAQVFYSPNREESRILALALQDSMIALLDPQNTRRAKMAPDTVFLMKKITSPAVTVECGFLSNVREAELLQNDAYQKRIAMSVMQGYINYLKGQ
ncbi:MAG: N-acetylmuramoyl-L-alanine amidase [Clostridia bacterium]|nr:N-acetylmuramoyl-L-alanine amidase [Clostridia bacterium]